MPAYPVSNITPSGQNGTVVIPPATDRQYGVVTLGGIPTPYNAPFTQADVTTTDDTLTPVASFSMSKDGLLQVATNVVAALEDGSDWAAWDLTGAIFVRASGIVTLDSPVGPQAPTASKSGGATSGTWTVVFGVSGQAATISVKGAPGVTILWSPRAAGNYNRRAL